MVSMLLRRDGGTYILRRVVPAPLRPIIGKRELRVSLRTKNVEDAKRLMKAEGMKIDRLLDAARRKLALLTQQPERLADTWKADALRADLAFRTDAPPRTEDDVQVEQDVLDDAILRAEQAIAENDTTPVREALIDLLTSHGLSGLPDEATRRLGRALLHAQLDALRIARRRAAGDFSAEPPVNPEAAQGGVLCRTLSRRTWPSVNYRVKPLTKSRPPSPAS